MLLRLADSAASLPPGSGATRLRLAGAASKARAAPHGGGQVDHKPRPSVRAVRAAAAKRSA